MRNDDILFIVNSYYVSKKKDSTEVSLPAAVAWKRRLNLKELIKASETIDEALKEIGEKFNDDEHSVAKTIKDSNGMEEEVRVVKSEYIGEYTKAKREILSQDTDVTIRKIKIGDLDGISLSEDMLDTIEFMIDDEE